MLGLSGRLHLPEGPERVRVLDAIGVLENADADFALLRNTMTHDPNKKNFRDEAYHNVTRSRGKHQQTEKNPWKIWISMDSDSPTRTDPLRAEANGSPLCDPIAGCRDARSRRQPGDNRTAPDNG